MDLVEVAFGEGPGRNLEVRDRERIKGAWKYSSAMFVRNHRFMLPYRRASGHTYFVKFPEILVVVIV